MVIITYMVIVWLYYVSKTMFSNGIYSKILLLTSRNKFMSTTDQVWIFFSLNGMSHLRLETK